MKVQQLRHLVAVADSVSYAQAAKACFTSRQNIAHSIKELETELGVALFERRGNELVCTEQGVQAARQANSILFDLDALRSLFATGSGEKRVMDLAVTMNLFVGIPEATSAYFSKRASELRFFELDCEGCYDSVCSGKVDAAFVMCMERLFPECSSIRVAAPSSFVLAGEDSALSKKRRINAADLRGTKLALMSKPPFQYIPLFKMLDALGYDRSDASVISSTSTMLNLVRSCSCVGIVSERFAQNPPRGTVAIPFDDDRLNWRFYMLYRRNGGGVILLCALSRIFAVHLLAPVIIRQARW